MVELLSWENVVSVTTVITALIIIYDRIISVYISD